MKQYNHFVEEEQVERFRQLASATGASVGDALRKTFDYCFFHADVLNRLYPECSGQLVFVSGRQ